MNVTFDFSRKIYIVTGASSGIGYQTALELLEAGAVVLGIARNLDLESCISLKERFPLQWVPVTLDVTQYDGLEATIGEFVEAYGKIDGLVHSAGTGVLLPVNVWDAEKANAVMNVNLWAGAALLKILSKKKYRQSNMAHVFISSVSAHKGQKALGIYAASKAALEAMVRCSAAELAAKGQRINSVCLGWIDTHLTRDRDNIVPDNLLGIGQPDDAAGMILFLLSDRSKWITGANFIIDGGYLA